MTTTTEEGKKRKKKIQKNLLSMSKHKNNKCFSESLLSESFPMLGVTAHLTSLGGPPTLCWFLDLLCGQLRVYSGPCPVCSCLQCPQLSELVLFLLWELSVAFIYSIHSKRVSGSTRYSGGLVAARAAGNRVLQKGMATSIGQYAPVFLPGEPPDREAWQATVHRAAKHWT